MRPASGKLRAAGSRRDSIELPEIEPPSPTASSANRWLEPGQLKIEANGPELKWLLGQVNVLEHESGRPLISALVVHKGGDLQPGAGFWRFHAGAWNRCRAQGREREARLLGSRGFERCYERWGRPSVRRVDDKGRAFKGSQLQVQIYVNRRVSELDAAIQDEVRELATLDHFLARAAGERKASSSQETQTSCARWDSSA